MRNYWFTFKIVNTFQDHLTRQLAEAVRIDLRGEEILNSKVEYSRCRVPRLRVDMEGWIEKKKVVAVVGTIEQVEATVTVTSHQEDEDDVMVKEAEESLVEKDIKRKVESYIPEGKPRRGSWTNWKVGEQEPPSWNSMRFKK